MRALVMFACGLVCLPVLAAAQQQQGAVVKPFGAGAGRAITAWEHCTEAAVDVFAGQPDPAATIVEAAFGACGGEEGVYMVMAGIRYAESIRETYRPGLLARVMAIRALRKGR